MLIGWFSRRRLCDPVLRYPLTFVSLMLIFHTYSVYHPAFRSRTDLTEYLITAAHKGDIYNHNNGQMWPEWLLRACPLVVQHFERFPYFANFTETFSVMTSEYAAHSVCSLRLAVHIAEAVGSPLYLHAGSQLGAIVHAGPTPWDDDIDVFMPFGKRDAFLAECARLRLMNGLRGARLECVTGHNALKLSVVTSTSIKTRRGWMAPFVDIFLFKADGVNIFEVLPTGESAVQRFALRDYFPVRPFFFAGTTVLGPREEVSLSRYDTNRCVVSCFHHRLESNQECRGQYEIDCELLAQHFPFVNASNETITDRKGQPLVVDNKVAVRQDVATSLWSTTPEVRQDWYMQGEELGQYLSDSFPNISKVEVDNSISNGCRTNGTLVVVEFNAERGTLWFRIAEMIAPLNPDFVILNEMDIGMARSGQQHTARMLATVMGMNYAWGIEFIELTRGTFDEQYATPGMYNFLGLHGNAILSRCPLNDAVIFRDPIGEYFSKGRTKVNAQGFERRLGGRMGLFASIQYSPTRTVALGSVHKVNTNAPEMRAYTARHNFAIVAGDQDWDFCSAVHLKHVDVASHHTYQASCSSLGTHRGDIICSNAGIHRAERTFLPCPRCPFGTKIRVSDHAFTSVTLYIP